VPRITLLFIGGIAEISREPDTARAELKIAAAGPAVSAMLVLFYGVLSFGLRHFGQHEAAAILRWLALVNLGLIVFNAIPGYPLDGGRVLRAWLWARTGNLRRATYIATRIGVGFSWLLIAFGVAMLGISALTRVNFVWNALVFFLIGGFLNRAAESGYAHTLHREMLGGVSVRDLMVRRPITIPAAMPLSLAVDEFFRAHHHVAFPVCGEDREFRGLLRLALLKDVPREKWPYTLAGDLVAEQASVSLFVDEAESAESTMRRMLAPGQGRLAVVENGRVTGMLTRHDVLQFIKIRTTLDS
jgi:CBS domain-containing protein